MCSNSAPQWCGDKGNLPTTKNVLVAWTVYINRNSLRSPLRKTVEMTQEGDTKLVHDLPVNILPFENDRDGNVRVCAGGIFIYALAICIFKNAYMVFAALLYLKECPL